MSKLTGRRFNRNRLRKNMKRELEPLNSRIQVCPKCRKVDVYKDDGHTCDAEYEAARQENQEYYD
jgi:hypothetical protein